jgi:hypothetical protein
MRVRPSRRTLSGIEPPAVDPDRVQAILDANKQK